MSDSHDTRHDHLSSQSVHELLTVLTALRAQQHMIKRWVQLRDTTDGYEKVLERLALMDAMVVKLSAELVAREAPDGGGDTGKTGDSG